MPRRHAFTETGSTTPAGILRLSRQSPDRFAGHYKGGDRTKESRGGHFREDYQNKDKTFGELNIILRREAGGEMQVVREKIPPLPAEMEQIIKEQQQ